MLASAGPERLARLLALQCELTNALRGVVLELPPDGEPTVAASWSGTAGAADPPWLGEAAQALAGRDVGAGPAALVRNAEGEDSTRHLLVQRWPDDADTSRGAAIEVGTDGGIVLALAVERLELSSRLLWLPEPGLGAETLAAVAEVAAACNAAPDFELGAARLVDRLVSQLGAARTWLAVAEGDAAHIVAVSQLRSFDRSESRVRELEGLLAACVRTRSEVAVPPGAGAGHESVAAHAEGHGIAGLMLLPWGERDPSGSPAGALAVELERAPTASELATCRLLLELVGAPLARAAREDAPLATRARRRLREVAAAARTPRHTGWKIAGALLAALLAWSLFGTTHRRVEAPVSLEAGELRVVSAPFEGRLAESTLEPGAVVEAGVTRIARLATDELELELSRARAEQARMLQEARVARGRSDPAAARVAELSASRAGARMTLLEGRIERADVLAPVSGVLVKGDLRRRIGAPVARGEPIAEVAPLDSMRAELYVDEHDVAFVAPGQRGEVRTAGAPGRPIAIEVLRIDPLAEPHGGRNTFRVIGRLLPDADGQLPEVMPGTQGAARVEAGEGRPLQVWLRPLTTRARLWLWR